MQPDAPALFHTTQWSMVLSAAGDSDTALEKLCRTYWRPLYVYARRSGRSEPDAEDMVQGFLAKVLEKQTLRTVDRETGPFRRFLQMAFKRYLLDDYDRTRAQKRGGGMQKVDLDAEGVEYLYAHDLSSRETPELAYERAWALEVFARARAALRAECEAAGRAEMHDSLESDEPYTALAERFGMTPGAFNSFAFRVRRRLQELVRAEILQTVNSQEDLEDEVAAMLRAMQTE